MAVDNKKITSQKALKDLIATISQKIKVCIKVPEKVAIGAVRTTRYYAERTLSLHDMNRQKSPPPLYPI